MPQLNALAKQFVGAGVVLMNPARVVHGSVTDEMSLKYDNPLAGLRRGIPRQ